MCYDVTLMTCIEKLAENSDGRLVAALLLKELTGLSQRDIGRHVGLGDGSGLGRLLKGAEGELASRWSLRRRYATCGRPYVLNH